MISWRYNSTDSVYLQLFIFQSLKLQTNYSWPTFQQANEDSQYNAENKKESEIII